ncbi:MAG: hypothetical protein M3R25_04785, partial [Bacteroidota bacterium]|nr:hypothetical protein [Bacteroidota bacterium]
MSKYILFICVFACLSSDQLAAQVVYERTFDPVRPSMEHPIQLSDTSSISFSTYNDCSFGAYIHHDKNGVEIMSESLDNESQHNVRARKIGLDSILFSYRNGAFDFGDQNYFKVSLWTPAGITPLIAHELPI